MRTKKKYFMPQWALTKIENLAKFYETTKTQALLLMLSKGSNYYEKVMKKAGVKQTEAPTDNNVADITDADKESIAQDLKNWWEDDPKVQEAKKKLEKETQRTIEIAKTKWIEDD